MTACTSECRQPTGSRYEHCTVSGCHQTFGGHALADAHRSITSTYVLAKPTRFSPSSQVQRFPSEAAVPKKWVIQSVGNQERSCLTVDEMIERGWRCVSGVWRGPKLDNAWWDREEDSEAES